MADQKPLPSETVAPDEHLEALETLQMEFLRLKLIEQTARSFVKEYKRSKIPAFTPCFASFEALDELVN